MHQVFSSLAGGTQNKNVDQGSSEEKIQIAFTSGSVSDNNRPI